MAKNVRVSVTYMHGEPERTVMIHIDGLVMATGVSRGKYAKQEAMLIAADALQSKGGHDDVVRAVRLLSPNGFSFKIAAPHVGYGVKEFQL